MSPGRAAMSRLLHRSTLSGSDFTTYFTRSARPFSPSTLLTSARSSTAGCFPCPARSASSSSIRRWRNARSFRGRVPGCGMVFSDRRSRSSPFTVARLCRSCTVIRRRSGFCFSSVSGGSRNIARDESISASSGFSSSSISESFSPAASSWAYIFSASFFTKMIDLDLPSHSFEPRLYGVGAWTSHLHFAYDLVAVLRPALFVELGVDRGESYFAFCQSVAENKTGTRCFGIDTWHGDQHAGGYDETTFAQVAEHNRANYEPFSSLLRSDFDEALSKFESESVDILHLDGLHTETAVRHDVES